MSFVFISQMRTFFKNPYPQALSFSKYVSVSCSSLAVQQKKLVSSKAKKKEKKKNQNFCDHNFQKKDLPLA